MAIFEFIKRLRSAMSVLWPARAIRIMRLGAQRVAEFRAEHGREPTDEEWKEISRRVDKEVTTSHS